MPILVLVVKCSKNKVLFLTCGNWWLQCHSGILGGGHYICYACNPNNRWYCYNDSSCKVMSSVRMIKDLICCNLLSIILRIHPFFFYIGSDHWSDRFRLCLYAILRERRDRLWALPSKCQRKTARYERHWRWSRIRPSKALLSPMKRRWLLMWSSTLSTLQMNSVVLCVCI